MVALSPAERHALPALRNEAVAVLGERYARMLLFGSRARGDSDEDSDVDLLIVVRSLQDGDENRIAAAAARLSLEHELALSPLVRSEAWLAAADGPLAREIARDGVELEL